MTIVRLPILQIAAELRRLAAFHGTNVHLNDDGNHSGCEDDYSLDIRLQVFPDGEWTVHYGDSSYDQDHRGAWGADSIPVHRGRDGHLRVSKFDSIAMARGLINGAVDMAVDGGVDVTLAYATPRKRKA